MNELFGGIKDKKFLFFAVAASVFLTIAVFLFFALNNNDKNSENPVATEVMKEENNVTPLSDEYIKSLTTPVKDKDITPLLDEYIKSLTTPVKDKDITPLSDEYIKSLTTPVN